MTDNKIIIGLDWGSLADFTACAVVECYYNEDDTGAYRVLETKRFKLGITYPQIVKALAKLDESIREKMEDADPIFIAESNGVGQPVIEMLREMIKKSRIYEVFTSGGESVTVNGRKITAGKKRMVTNLSGMLSAGRLTFSKEDKALINELQNFRGFQLDSGKEEFEAKTGAHDDLIMALSFAVLWGEQMLKRYRVGAPINRR